MTPAGYTSREPGLRLVDRILGPLDLDAGPLGTREEALYASRLLCCLAIFAFITFAAVDPFVADGSLRPLLLLRALLVFGGLCTLASTWLPLARTSPELPGIVVSAWTGMGVILLAEATGGSSSPYWPMLILTFFGTALVLPLRATQAAVLFGGTALSYPLWLLALGGTSSMAHWVGSVAGVLLSAFVSVLGVLFVARWRERSELLHGRLVTLNEELKQQAREREAAEAGLAQTQRLEAVGRLAAGLSHEMNNVLAGIVGAASLARDRHRGDPDLEADLALILAVSERGAKLNSDLLGFARAGSTETEYFSINEIIRLLANLLGRTHRGTVQIETELGARMPQLEGDRQLLLQALLNLCLNGIDAMDGRGTLTIRSSQPGQEAVDDKTDPQASQAAHVRVEIIDRGRGMSEETLAHAIDPFFTTKPPGEGTGLGLSMAYGTFQKHGGSLELQSTEGEGTRAIVLLPATERVAAEEREADPQPESTGPQATQPKSILVVDDDEVVRTLLCRTLELAGYEVLTAENGAEGLQLFRSTDRVIDLVLLDMRMPVMDGYQAFRQLRTVRPDQPILLCSGYAQDELLKTLLKSQNCNFIRKPFAPEGLILAVRELLG